MKKLFPYALFSTAALVLSVILAYVCHFPLSNSRQAGVVLAFVFGPYWVYFWKQLPKYREKSAVLSLALRFSLVLLLIGYLISVYTFFAVGW